jgi:hypothetical protein
MNVLILFGCNGHVEESGFICCNSIVNPILDLSKVEKGTREKVLHFLENACGLFDAPCNDYNKCVNIINFLYRQFGIIDEERLHEIQAFLKMHKRCGIYIIMSKEDSNV